MASPPSDQRHHDELNSPSYPLSVLSGGDHPRQSGESPTGPSQQTQQDEQRPEEQFYSTGLRLFLVLTSLLLSIFCEALDETIIATAIPRITGYFHRLTQVGWYGSAYLLTNCAFQLFYGKLYRIFPLRWVFMTALFVFELGSLVSAVAPTSETLIAGRAIAGLGAAGMTSGALNIMAHTTPPATSTQV
jgi:hypothetical protein